MHGSGMDVHSCGKHHDQKQLGRKGFVAFYSLLSNVREVRVGNDAEATEECYHVAS